MDLISFSKNLYDHKEEDGIQASCTVMDVYKKGMVRTAAIPCLQALGRRGEGVFFRSSALRSRFIRGRLLP